MKQTAVEWLGKELESYGDPQFCKLEWETLDSLIQQAKEMEKEQQGYSEEEVLELLQDFANDLSDNVINIKFWFNKFKKK